MYVLYALSLDGFGVILTEVGRSDPAAYLSAVAAGGGTDGKYFGLCRGCTGEICIYLLSFFFGKQEEGVCVLYELSLDGLGIKLTELGRSDPSAYLAAAAAVVPTAIFCTVQGLYER